MIEPKKMSEEDLAGMRRAFDGFYFDAREDGPALLAHIAALDAENADLTRRLGLAESLAVEVAASWEKTVAETKAAEEKRAAAMGRLCGELKMKLEDAKVRCARTGASADLPRIFAGFVRQAESMVQPLDQETRDWMDAPLDLPPKLTREEAALAFARSMVEHVTAPVPIGETHHYLAEALIEIGARVPGVGFVKNTRITRCDATGEPLWIQGDKTSIPDASIAPLPKIDASTDPMFAAVVAVFKAEVRKVEQRMLEAFDQLAPNRSDLPSDAAAREGEKLEALEARDHWHRLADEQAKRAENAERDSHSARTALSVWQREHEAFMECVRETTGRGDVGGMPDNAESPRSVLRSLLARAKKAEQDAKFAAEEREAAEENARRGFATLNAEIESVRDRVKTIADELTEPHPVDRSTQDLLTAIERAAHACRIAATNAEREVDRLLFERAGGAAAARDVDAETMVQALADQARTAPADWRQEVAPKCHQERWFLPLPNMPPETHCLAEVCKDGVGKWLAHVAVARYGEASEPFPTKRHAMAWCVDKLRSMGWKITPVSPNARVFVNDKEVQAESATETTATFFVPAVAPIGTPPQALTDVRLATSRLSDDWNANIGRPLGRTTEDLIEAFKSAFYRAGNGASSAEAIARGCIALFWCLESERPR